MTLARSLLVIPLLCACNQAPPAAAPAAPAPSTPAASASAAAPVAAPVAVNEVVVDHKVEALDGSTLDLSSLRGKALLIVNTASECGFTPHYAQLQELYGRYKDRGLVVLGFPSNDFGGQEPGDAAEIREFVTSKYAVDFPMMAKVHARGDEIAPLYKALSEQTAEGIRGEVRWNFTKFLVDTEGKVIARFEPPTEPMSEELVKAVEAALPKG
jgi:glutathione peroxidase